RRQNRASSAPHLLCLVGLLLLLLCFLDTDQRLLRRPLLRKVALRGWVASTFHRRHGIVDAYGHQQAFEHFHVARHAAVLGLADATRLVRSLVLGPALVELLFGAVLVGHAALVILRYGEIHRLVDGGRSLAAGCNIEFWRIVRYQEQRPRCSTEE